MKKVLVITMGPVFPDVIHGGSQKILVSIAKHLGKIGNQVSILCSNRSGLKLNFTLSENVEVYPILKFKQPFPDPYRAPISDVFASLTEIKRFGNNVDVIYVHDGSIDCKLLFPKTPIVVSVRDMLYSESIIGFFAFRRDELIVNSIFAYESALSLSRDLVDGLEYRLHLINNGLDNQLFNPRDKDKSRAMLNIHENRFCLAFPHRTVEEKGIGFLIRVMQEIEKRESEKLTILFTEWQDADNQYYDNGDCSIKEYFKSHGLTSEVVTVPWLDQSMMPYVYSAANITLCLGNAPELFGGNVALESLACGTPVICSAVGAYRSTLPADWINLVPYGCEIDAAETVIDILRNRGGLSNEIIDKIKKDYSLSKMLSEYERVIINASVKDEIKSKEWAKKKNNVYKLAPWCGVFKFGYYHDFRQEYYPRNSLTNYFFQNGKAILQISEINDKDIIFDMSQMIDKDLLIEG